MPRRQLPLPLFDRASPRLKELYARRLSGAAPPDPARRPEPRQGGSAAERGPAGAARPAEADETAARHFWGRRWQEHLEAAPVFARRLPGGRACWRKSTVQRLGISTGRVQGMIVRGFDVKHVDVRIRKLGPDAWQAIRIACLGQIGSESDLREGRVSGHVRDVLTDPGRGLFPAPDDVKPRCMCGDWTLPCKHVMAVLWGVGGYFDTDPLLLFRLRGVRPAELIGNLMPHVVARGRPGVLAEEALAEIFDIVLEPGPGEPAFSYHRRTPVAGPRKTPAGDRGPGNDASAEGPAPARRGDTAANRKPGRDSAAGKPGRGGAAGKPSRGPATEPASPPGRSASAGRPTGPLVASLRERTGFTVAELAGLLRVSPATVRRWETTPGPLRLRPPQREALLVLHGGTGSAE